MEEWFLFLFVNSAGKETILNTQGSLSFVTLDVGWSWGNFSWLCLPDRTRNRTRAHAELVNESQVHNLTECFPV